MDKIDTIKLSHGSGKGLENLLREVVLPILLDDNESPLEDSAIIPKTDERLAFTTDSFVVTPLEFPGGDIGKLAACGTINDLSMMGAKPLYLSVSLILEESLDVNLLKRVLASLKKICDETNVKVVCGDTKVVSKGSGDGIFITTSGIGSIPENLSLSVTNIKAGDKIIVSGPIGLHGITILVQRKNLSIASEIKSDCAPLYDISSKLLSSVTGVKSLRDATRGGVAAILNEMAKSSSLTFQINEESIPVPDEIKGALSYLGMEALSIANEGRFVAIVNNESAEDAVQLLNSHPLGKGATIIGVVQEFNKFPVIMETLVGALRPIETPPGELLPRIC